MPDGVLQWPYVSELASTEEEADNEIFLECWVAEVYGFEKVKITTVDSVAAILSSYHQKKLNVKIYFEYETGIHLQLLDTSTCLISPDMYKALPSIFWINSLLVSCFNFSIKQSEKCPMF